MKRRLLTGAIILVAWSAAIEARLVYLQVIRHNDLAARARDQQTGTVEMPAKRGDILDRNGRVLAFSVDAESVYAVPTDIADADQAAPARAVEEARTRVTWAACPRAVGHLEGGPAWRLS